MEYILASMSPRRKEILEKMGLAFTVEPADIDENISVSEPSLLVSELAFLKGSHIAKKHVGEEKIIISADTVVALEDKILGKPKDKKDAYDMLKMLSGKKHSVYTGYCVADAKEGKILAKCEKTDVYFKNLTDEEINAYVESGEPMDKAGAYGIQGGAGAFCEKIEGEFSNVVGLPENALKKVLLEEFVFEGR